MVPDVIAEDRHPSTELMRKYVKMWVWTSATRHHMATKPRVSPYHVTINVQPRRQPNPMLTHITPHPFPGPGQSYWKLFI